jgi:D-tyrosyl-tRNA(Tyr) deacylase
LYEHFVAQAQKTHPVVQTGRFAADMKVALINDGPITIPMRMTV